MANRLRIAITMGEPAGVGPDIVVRMLEKLVLPFECVVVGDPELLEQRAMLLGVNLKFDEFNLHQFRPKQAHQCSVLPVPLSEKVVPGRLNVQNSDYVVSTLQRAGEGCLNKNFSAVVTAPVHKGIINQAGINFTGHTEFFANLARVNNVVMMLQADKMRVALVTTHLPLSKVANAITREKLTATLQILHHDLRAYFDLKNPHIFVSGLNPHAGEQGELGNEEIEIIAPVLKEMQLAGMQLTGPLPADTLFLEKNIKQADVFLVMYHDQGLPVIKFYNFDNAVNITLGLPFVRTSVDHGTALELAGTKQASIKSLQAALITAINMVNHVN